MKNGKGGTGLVREQRLQIKLPMARPQFPEFMSSNTTSHA
jgi:hypothetical protein